jgi:energy-coupling factor transporter ATP-binding protein EcfA2
MTELALPIETAELVASEPRRPPLLEVSGLNLRFGGVAALTDVSFEVAAGELFGLIGPNGAGKTCILNCLNGVYRPQAGRVSLDGHDLLAMTPPETAEAGADAIGCGPRELGGNRAIGPSGRESSRMLRRFPPRSPFETDPAQRGDAIPTTAMAARFQSSSTGLMIEQVNHVANWRTLFSPGERDGQPRPW